MVNNAYQSCIYLNKNTVILLNIITILKKFYFDIF